MTTIECDELRRDVEHLNEMLRRTGYGQGQIDAHAAMCDELEAVTAKLVDPERVGREKARREFVAAVRKHLPCCCDRAYTDRGLTAPDCPWHNYAVELLTEDEFAAGPKTEDLS